VDLDIRFVPEGEGWERAPTAWDRGASRQCNGAEGKDGRPIRPAGPSEGSPLWSLGVLYHDGLTEENLRGGPHEVEVDVPEGADRVLLYYLSSGHCTDGRGEDEFLSKDNVILADDGIVFRFRPWRDDCERFRSLNPYTRRWSDGSWSSDYPRSGWCPGDVVDPVVLDVTDRMSPGGHTLAFTVDDVRPEDDGGNYGYWRVSAYLVGWKE
jgi:hypothetical protein